MPLPDAACAAFVPDRMTRLKAKIDKFVKDGQVEIDRLLREQPELYFERRKQLTEEYEAMLGGLNEPEEPDAHCWWS